MTNLTGFNANEVPPMAPRVPIPAGNYKIAITASEMKATKNKDGKYLAITMEVVEGDHQGRKLYTNLNLDNKSNVAVEIAKSELSSICRATGVLTPNDSVELHGKPFVAGVTLVKRNDNGEMQNRVAKYTSLKDANAATEAPLGAGMEVSNSEAAPW